MRFLLLLMFLVGSTHAADIQITAVKQNWIQQQLTITPQYQITSSDVIDEAVNNGIVLTLIAKLQVIKDRPFWFDKKLNQQHQTYQIRYFSLSGQYQLQNTTTQQTNNFVLLRELWRFLEQQTQFTLSSEDTATADYLSLRLRLDNGALPSALQLPVLLSADWTFKSDWFDAPLESQP